MKTQLVLDISTGAVSSGIDLLKDKNRNARIKCQICSKLTIKVSLLLTLNIFHSGFRQTWKTWKKQCFLWHSGKTWKTQGILRKYFKFLENSGNSVEIDFLTNLLYFLATIYFKWHYLFFTLYATVIAGFFYLHIYFVWVTGSCLKWPTLAVYFEMQLNTLCVHFIIYYIDSFYFLFYFS